MAMRIPKPSIAAFMTALILAPVPGAFAQELPNVSHMDFKGRFLVAISDADMVASAYSDGRLGPEQGQDTLSVIRLDRPPSQWRASSVPVGNSVVGPPTAMTLTPDGRYAIVVETRGPRPADKADGMMTDLPNSRKISVVDLGDPDNPTVIQTLEGFAQPSTVSINAGGNLVAITYALGGDGRETPLALYRFENGQLSLLSTPAIPDWTPGDLLIDASLHPQSNILALTNWTRPELTLVEVVGEGEATRVERWGNSIALDWYPFTSKFTPDGRHVLSNSIYAGLGTQAPKHGTITSVRLDMRRDADGAPRHSFVSRAQVGAIPEGLAISPDGKWVATANLERSSAPHDSPEQGFFSSLSLLRIDAESGHLTTVGTHAYDGILPESVVFDNSSRFVAATTFDQYDGRSPGGSIDFWRISGDHANADRIELVKTSYTVPVTRGAHVLSIVQ
ncbi:hypothetical protein [Agrobacterium sp. NPDC090283]|uniref:hypothetical protein n=1 Tax=Agrobacterium sp. NPDC090283 TaxID=3363920 RepID=UPI00383B24DF